jgi:hypothetical protein
MDSMSTSRRTLTRRIAPNAMQYETLEELETRQASNRD